MADRAALGGGVARPISPVLQGSTDRSAGIETGGPADWFGPGNPMQPVAPQEVRGRGFDFPIAYNLVQRPRAYEGISFEQLRQLADSYDLLRLAIETRKDQMSRLAWSIQPRDSKDTGKADAAKALTEFFESPDKVNDWDTWLRMVLEDLLVLDAPAIYARPNRGGGLYGFKPLDGATIKRVIDDWADTPLPPAPAYQQTLKGFAAVNYTTDQLIYRPRNPRTNKVYGFGPVEQVVMIVNIALRRQTWQLGFFTSGNLPDALLGTPNEWTPEQIREFQDWFDNRLKGNAENRRGGTFVPGDVAKSFVQTKENELFGKGEEWMARVICYAFSLSPQSLVKEVNRATAETAKTAAEEEGLEPLKLWVKRLIDFLLRKYLAAADFHFVWSEEVEIEPKTQSDIVVAEASKALISINEARKIKGLEPWPNPIFDEPMFLASDGWVPADPEKAMEIARQKMELAAEFAPDPAAGPPGSGDDPDGKPPKGGKAKPKPGEEDKGKTPAAAGAKDKGGAEKAAQGSEGLGSLGDGGEGACSAEGVDAASSSFVRKFAPSWPTVERPLARRVRKSIARKVGKLLAELGDDVAAQIDDILDARKLAKADEPGDPPDHGDGVSNDDRISGAIDDIAAGNAATAVVDDILRRLDLSSLEGIVDAVEGPLFELAVDGAKKALAGVGVTVEGDLVNQVNAAAVEFARNRSAELVGKRWVNGVLMDNPNAAYRISDTTRELLRGIISKGLEDNVGTPAIAENIQNSFAFSEKRADLIAQTEVANANEQSKLTGWRDARAAGLKIKKAWKTSGDDEVCPVCIANEAQGAIDLDEDFQSGDDASPAHPRCECVTVPEVEASAAETGGKTDGE